MEILDSVEIQNGKEQGSAAVLAYYMKDDLIEDGIEPWRTDCSRFSIYITDRNDHLPDKGPQVFCMDKEFAVKLFEKLKARNW